MKEKFRRIKEYVKQHVWPKYILIWVGLLVAGALGMNDNYHASLWINRIVPPYKHEGMTWFPGTIILIIAVYNLFRGFYFTTGNYLCNKGWKCFICTILFINIVGGINSEVVQKIRRLQSGLHSIYLERDKMMSINLYNVSSGEERIYRTEGFSRIKNCSNETVGPFKVTIIMEEDERHPGGSFTCEKIYELGPREERIVDLYYEGPLNESIGEMNSEDNMDIITEGIQMILWDEQQQVVFYSE